MSSLSPVDAVVPTGPDRDLEALVRGVALAANSARTPVEAIGVAVSAVCEQTGWPVGLAWEVQDDLDVTPMVVHAEAGYEQVADAVPAGPLRPDAAVAAIATAGVPALARGLGAGTGTPEPLSTRARGAGLDASYCFAVTADGRTRLVLEFLVTSDRPPAPPVVAVMDTVCRQLGAVVARDRDARRRIQVVTDIATRAPAGQAEGTSRPRIDAVTGLACPWTFADDLDRHLVTAEAPVAVVCVGIDRLGMYDVWLGPGGGDRVLRAVAEQLADALGSPSGVARVDDGFLARIDAVPPSELSDCAWRVLEWLDVPLAVGDRAVSVGVSVGIAGTDQLPDADGHELVHAADTALRAARQRGVRRVEVYDAASAPLLDTAPELHVDLHGVVEREELVVHHQPVVELPSGRLCGLEALVRWRHPTAGLVLPAGFVPEAERTGLIRRIGRAVLVDACTEGVRWQRLAGRPIDVGVNISAAQLDDPRFVDDVLEVLATAGLAPARLVLEVTETTISQDPGRSVERLSALRQHGVRVAVDDFGAGYSSLERLSRHHFDQLKLDRSLLLRVRDMDDPAPVLRAAADLGRALDMEVVAEGIETPAQLAAVLRSGCHRAQGFLFSPPLPAHEVAALLVDPAAHAGLGPRT